VSLVANSATASNQEPFKYKLLGWPFFLLKFNL
jgi:hypothetical protein